MCGKGSSGGTRTTTQNQTSTTTANPEAMEQYRWLMQQGRGVVENNPWNPATGQQVAGFTNDQTQAFGNIRSGIAQPYVNTAAGMTFAGAGPASQGMSQYYNPWNDQVVDATIRDFDVQNARQMSGVTGNARMAGSLGGDREAVARALTAEAQSRTQSPVLANLRAQGFNTALSAAQDDAGRSLQGAGIMGNLGNLAYTDTQALMSSGAIQQALEQQRLNAASGNAAAQSAYPFQSLGWLANLATGIGSQMGSTTNSTGTSTGVTQGPTPNTWSQAIGLGLAAIPYLNAGGRIAYAGGGGIGYVPDIQIQRGGGPQPHQMMSMPLGGGGGASQKGLADHWKEITETAKSADRAYKGAGKASEAMRTEAAPNGWGSVTTTYADPAQNAAYGLSNTWNGITSALGFADGGAVHRPGEIAISPSGGGGFAGMDDSVTRALRSVLNPAGGGYAPNQQDTQPAFMGPSTSPGMPPNRAIDTQPFFNGAQNQVDQNGSGFQLARPYMPTPPDQNGSGFQLTQPGQPDQNGSGFQSSYPVEAQPLQPPSAANMQPDQNGSGFQLTQPGQPDQNGSGFQLTQPGQPDTRPYDTGVIGQRPVEGQPLQPKPNNAWSDTNPIFGFAAGGAVDDNDPAGMYDREPTFGGIIAPPRPMAFPDVSQMPPLMQPGTSVGIAGSAPGAEPPIEQRPLVDVAEKAMIPTSGEAWAPPPADMRTGPLNPSGSIAPPAPPRPAEKAQPGFLERAWTWAQSPEGEQALTRAGAAMMAASAQGGKGTTGVHLGQGMMAGLDARDAHRKSQREQQLQQAKMQLAERAAAIQEDQNNRAAAMQPYDIALKQAQANAQKAATEGSKFIQVDPSRPLFDSRTKEWITPPGGLVPKPSEAQKTIDREFGKDYAEFVNQGGYADIEKNINTLRSVKKELESGKELTGWITGRVPDSIQSVLNPGAVDVRNRVEEVVQRNLRLVLGAQFTQVEGENLIKRAYNPLLDEKTNANRLNALISAMDQALQAKKAAAEHYEKFGTLANYKGVWRVSAGDLEKAMDQAAPTRTSPPAAAVQYLRNNPQTASDFDRKYGSGAAAAILGTRTP